MEGPRECHNKITQPIPSTKNKRKPLLTETTLFQVNDGRKIALSSPTEVINPLQLRGYYFFLLNMAFNSSSEKENIHI